MKKRMWQVNRLLALLVLSIAVLGLVVSCGRSFSSNGQRVYFTATDESGQSITYTGGPGMMKSRLACVYCHGTEGHGGTVALMMQRFEVPNITWAVLTAQGMDHPPYTEETFKRTISQGIDPAGNPLEYPMPRWQMSDSDLNDLTVFIKTQK